MALEGRVLARLERVEHVGADVDAVRAVVAAAHDVGSGARPPSEPRSFSSPRRMRPLTVPSGLAEHRRDLAVGEAAEVRELDHAALLVGERLERRPHLAGLLAPRGLDVRALLGDQALGDALVRGAAPVVGAGPAEWSIARWWTMPSTHVRTEPRARS